jgi:hypothetical protein
MDDLSNKKIKVDLTKIGLNAEVALRSALPFLDKVGVILLQELLFSSLETSIEEVAEAVDLAFDEVEEGLDQLLPLGLFVKNGSKLTLNKEKRRTLEIEAQKFEEDFHPDLNYLKARLSLLPPSVLLDWYVVPRSCHDIFSSLVEKHFQHPRFFQRYIEELQFDDHRLQTIVKELYHSEGLALSFQDFQVAFGISREELHSLLLLLEYHFVAFLKYLPTSEGWEEMIVPIKEWHDYAHWVGKGIEPSSYPVEPTDKIPQPEKTIYLKERQVKGIERRLKGAKIGEWVSIDQFLSHLDIPMHEPHEPLLETRGRRWSYTLPNHTVEDKAAFRSLLFERFAKAGVVIVGKKDNRWYFSLTRQGKDFLS